MSRFLYRIGAGAARHPWRVVSGWLFAALLIGALASAFGGTMQDSFKIPGSDTQRTNEVLVDHFPAMSGTSARVVAHTETGSFRSSDFAAVREALRDLTSVSDVPPAAVSQDRRTAVLSVQYDVPVTEFEGDEALDELESAAAPLVDAGYRVEFGGPVPENAQEVSSHAEMLGVAVALVVLLFAFGAMIAASLPLAVAFTGLAIGTSGVTLLAAVTDMSTNARPWPRWSASALASTTRCSSSPGTATTWPGACRCPSRRGGRPLLRASRSSSPGAPCWWL
jgi:RND superfamily putative drug exporter